MDNKLAKMAADIKKTPIPAKTWEEKKAMNPGFWKWLTDNPLPVTIAKAALLVFVVSIIFNTLCDKDKGALPVEQPSDPTNATSGNNNTNEIPDNNNQTTDPQNESEDFLKPIGGDQSKTCASQGFVRCLANEFCDASQWVKSIDGPSCCSSTCKDRVQAILLLPDNEPVIVEKVTTGLIVWYGTTSPVLGLKNFVRASLVNDITYNFKLPNNQEHNFNLTENTPTSISVVYT